MKIDTVLIGEDGHRNMDFQYSEIEIKDGKEMPVNKKKDLTFRFIFIKALLAPAKSVNQKGVVTDDDYRTELEKYKLFVKIRDAEEEIEFNTEEIQLLKLAVGKIHQPLILGQCDKILG